MGIILAILLFSAIVIFHELGHFLLAKKNKPVRYIIRGIMILLALILLAGICASLWGLDRLFLENSLEKRNSA